ncbi:coiled-coil domain-containing protein 62 [Mugil cephalus]|uniref:coiled-coil domain-containing protein 62 n=1 Tax=Mugil cephalus TaxID=48193 RepID=UPI001FB594FC|nr:coiled-coil domain-containing protein 62 [Mugil cephalus]
MDQGGRHSFALSHGASADFWHSTPVKKKNEGAPLDAGFRMDNTGVSPLPGDTCGPPSWKDAQFPVSDLSSSTIQRQRRELQLLMSELKDRERELNAMAAAHQKQHQAWEQDRHRTLTLEQRCSRLDDELQKRNAVIRVLTKRVVVVETREKEVQKELGEAQQLLRVLEKKQEHIRGKCQDFEEKNQSLSSTVTALSTQVGSLQVREEELSSMLKLKDKDVTEASRHILDLSGRLRDLEAALAESRSRENKLLRDVEESKRRYREARHDVTQLKEELKQQVTQSSTQREEMIRLKQELHLLRTDVALTGEGDSWKDELLELSRSKQERLTGELLRLRQVCENQRNDLQLLQKSSQGSAGSQDELTCNCLEHQSPSSLRGKNQRRDSSNLTSADLQGSVNNDLGVFLTRLMDEDHPLSSSALQQLLDESRPVVSSSLPNSGPTMQSSGTSGPPHFHKSHSPQHHPSTSILKTSETPPKSCPRHGAIHPSMWTS